MSPTDGTMSAGLLERTSQGDPQAVRECITRFGGLVWSLARRLTYTEAEAEDAVQEIFVEIWKNAPRFDASIASETAFVAMIARRRLIDRRRKASRQLDNEPLPEAVTLSRPTPDQLGELGDEAARATEALSQLSTEQQKVLRLSIYHGLSHEKIARSVGLPLGTVKTHARRGLIRLRAILESEPGSGDGDGNGTRSIAQIGRLDVDHARGAEGGS
jgi:RNA polymerase sigma factor (sigma-70 family)